MSDDVAQELQMPIGPQALSDVEAPMPWRPAILRDPGTPDEIIVERIIVDRTWRAMGWLDKKIETLCLQSKNTRLLGELQRGGRIH